MRLSIVLFVLLTFAAGTIDAQDDAICGTAAEPSPITVSADGTFPADLSAQIVAYLDARGSSEGLAAALEAASNGFSVVSAQVVAADFTGDRVPDVAVLVDQSQGTSFRLMLGLYTCTADAYRVLDVTEIGTGSPISQDAGPAELVLAVDLNSNGRRDILLAKRTIEGSKIHETLTIYEWDGAELAQTFHLGPTYGGYGAVTLVNSDDDPTGLEIAIEHVFAYEQGAATAFIEYSMIRPIILLYRPTATGYEPICRHFDDDPSLLVHILHSAETLRACGLYREAEIFYERLWYQSGEADPWASMFGPWLVYPDGLTPEEQRAYAARLERRYLRAFAGYRLVQFALMAGEAATAETVLNQLTADYPPGEQGHIYAAMTAALWDSYQQTGDLSAACAAAAAARSTAGDPGIPYYIEGAGTDIFHPGFYYDRGFRYGSPPDDVFAVPDDIAGMIAIPVCLT